MTTMLPGMTRSPADLVVPVVEDDDDPEDDEEGFGVELLNRACKGERASRAVVAGLARARGRNDCLNMLLSDVGYTAVMMGYTAMVAMEDGNWMTKKGKRNSP